LRIEFIPVGGFLCGQVVFFDGDIIICLGRRINLSYTTVYGASAWCPQYHYCCEGAV
jgi:hypothetical protein